VEERRCPNCSALVSEDAEWCGQCFTSLRAPPAEPPAVAPTPPSASEPAKASSAPTWPCPACGEANPIELDTCRVCGTPFAQLFREPEIRPTISPRDAFLWSLTFPGVGHAKAGRAGDGIARGTLFVLTFGLTLVIAFSGASTGPLRAVVVLLLVSSLTVYLGSAFEASRIADGGEPLVSARALLWTTVAVVMLSVGLLTASVFSVSGR
jgi:Double zinc ribbon